MKPVARLRWWIIRPRVSHMIRRLECQINNPIIRARYRRKEKP